MKRNIIALAVASAIAAPVVMADAPTVYGIANMAVEMNKTGDKSGTGINNVASRFGIKGSEDLGNGLKAVYQMEFGVNMEGKDALSNRNQYVGLAGGFGTVLLGRHDTPVKMAQGTDLFDDGMGDNQSTTAIGWKGGENRLDNVLAYVSPSFGGVTVALAAVSAEGESGDKSTIGNALSGAIMYGSKKKGLYLAAAYEQADKHMGYKKAVTADPTKYIVGNPESFGAEDKYMRLVAQYAVSGLIVNGMYQMHDLKITGTNVSLKNFTASAGYKFGDFMPKIKVSIDEGDKGIKGGTYVGAGLNYALGKSTTAYIELNQFDKKMASNNGADFKTGVVPANKEYLATAIGLQHKF